MMILNANNLRKMFGEEVLFDNVSFHVEDMDRIGFVGANGAGKSTLFKILAGDMNYDAGDIFKNKYTKIGYLDQYACSDSDNTVFDELLTVFSEVVEIEQELEEIRFDIENQTDGLETLIRRQNALNERFAELDGFYYRSKIRAALLGLGFSEDEFGLRVQSLSGGQKTRVELGKILLSDANLLLLDEPTNHLDISSVEWLEEFLLGYKGAVIVISHDRYFLDRVTNRTFELEGGKLFSMDGNYSAYVKQREIEKLTQERNYENTKKEIERLEGVVEQQRRWNREKNIKTAESKLKVIERLEKTLEKPQERPENIKFRFKAAPGGGNDVLIAEGLSMAFGEKTLFRNVDIHIQKGERVFLLGPNGCGKTTLLKIMMGQLAATAGTYKIGANTHVGYYDQIQEHLHMEKTVIDEVWDTYPKMTQTEVRNALAAFLFRGEDVFKEISKLSGGERARVELVKLMLKRVNFLIMDEPTNHLDIQSKEALEAALADYDGTMLVVSHDRYFINKLASRILRMDGERVLNYAGNYDYYLEKFKESKPEAAKSKPAANDYKEKKRMEAEKRKTVSRYHKVEEWISEKEHAIDALNQTLATPEVATDYVKAGALTAELETLEQELEALLEEWETLHMRIEEFE